MRATDSDSSFVSSPLVSSLISEVHFPNGYSSEAFMSLHLRFPISLFKASSVMLISIERFVITVIVGTLRVCTWGFIPSDC